MISLDTQEPFQYQCALVRGLSSSFENSLKLNPPSIPIRLDLAFQQHEKYIELIKTLVSRVIEVDSDPKYPDCNFIEDTAVIIGDTAVISRLGVKERQGEERAVAEALATSGLRNRVFLEAPARMDGGDVLFTGKHIFVGLSKRTNREAIHQLEKVYSKKFPVLGIPVVEGLHLKSLISHFNSEILVVADTPAGRVIQKEIDSLVKDSYQFVFVPDAPASNVLRIGSTLVAQSGFQKSEVILRKLCEENEVNFVALEMSELIKADGALTCGSLLIPF